MVRPDRAMRHPRRGCDVAVRGAGPSGLGGRDAGTVRAAAGRGARRHQHRAPYAPADAGGPGSGGSAHRLVDRLALVRGDLEEADEVLVRGAQVTVAYGLRRLVHPFVRALDAELGHLRRVVAAGDLP